MSKFIAGVLTTVIIMFVIYAFKTKDIRYLGLAFLYMSVMWIVYGINFGVFLEREDRKKK